MPYEALLLGVMAFVARAAVAWAADESDWEQEQVRRNGLSALKLCRDGKALWDDAQTFADELAEACVEGVLPRFRAQNELDRAFFERLDQDLRARWRGLGYEAPSLRDDMKPLFLELQRDVADATLHARECVLAGLLLRLQEGL